MILRGVLWGIIWDEYLGPNTFKAIKIIYKDPTVIVNDGYVFDGQRFVSLARLVL